MRITALLASFLLVACTRAESKPAQQPFDTQHFLVDSLQTTASMNELGTLAFRRARQPSTRELGVTVVREIRPLRVALNRAASTRRVAVPAAPPEPKLALKQNLGELPDPLFDRGYTFSALQEIRSLRRALERATTSDDNELREIARNGNPVLADLEKQADAVMKKLGGPPFGFEP